MRNYCTTLAFLIGLAQSGGCVDPDDDAVVNTSSVEGPDVETPYRDDHTRELAQPLYVDRPDFAIDGPAPASESCAGAEEEAMVGAGTPDDPYLLCLPSDLALLGTDVYSMDSAYRLAADLDVAQLNPPLGRLGSGAAFTGSLDGLGHRIDGLLATLFETVETGAVVRNLRLTGISAGPWMVRGVLANTNRGTIAGVHARAEIVGGCHVGILIGTNEGWVESCFTEGTITDGAAHVGGLVGYNAGTIRGSGSAASVQAHFRVGGLVGMQAYPGVIEESYALGPVDGGDATGGLVGSFASGVITNSYAASASVAGSRVGGLVGDVSSGYGQAETHAITNSYAAGPLSGEGAQGLVGAAEGGPALVVTASYFHDAAEGPIGVPLSAAQLGDISSFPTWDFDTVWELDPKVSEYPSLRSQPSW